MTREQINNLSEAEFHARDAAVGETACDLRKIAFSDLYTLVAYSSTDFKDDEDNMYVTYITLKEDRDEDAKQYPFMLVYTFNEESNTREFMYDSSVTTDPKDIENAEEIVNFFLFGI